MLSGIAPPAHKGHNTPAAVGKLLLGRASQHEMETSARMVEFIRNKTVGPVGGSLQNSNNDPRLCFAIPKTHLV